MEQAAEEAATICPTALESKARAHSHSQNSHQGCLGLPYMAKGTSLQAPASAQCKCTQRSAAHSQGKNTIPTGAPELVWTGFSPFMQCYPLCSLSPQLRFSSRLKLGHVLNILLPLVVVREGESSPRQHGRCIGLGNHAPPIPNAIRHSAKDHLQGSKQNPLWNWGF